LLKETRMLLSHQWRFSSCHQQIQLHQYINVADAEGKFN
jgi:hypothetical protein